MAAKKTTPFAQRALLENNKVSISIEREANLGNPKNYVSWSDIVNIAYSKQSKLFQIPTDTPAEFDQIRIEIVLESKVKKIVISNVNYIEDASDLLDKAKTPAKCFTFEAQIPKIGISICNFSAHYTERRAEVLYIALSGAKLEYSNKDGLRDLEFILRDLNLNNNLHPNTSYPVILRKQHSKDLSDPTRDQEALKFRYQWDISTDQEMYNIKKLRLTINKLQIFLEEEYFLCLEKLFSDITTQKKLPNLLDTAPFWDTLGSSPQLLALKRHFTSNDQLEIFLQDLTNHG